jgi:hypothetical protein
MDFTNQDQKSNDYKSKKTKNNYLKRKINNQQSHIFFDDNGNILNYNKKSKRKFNNNQTDNQTDKKNNIVSTNKHKNKKDGKSGGGNAGGPNGPNGPEDIDYVDYDKLWTKINLDDDEDDEDDEEYVPEEVVDNGNTDDEDDDEDDEDDEDDFIDEDDEDDEDDFIDEDDDNSIKVGEYYRNEISDDHILIALNTLKDLRRKFSKLSVKDIIDKFNEEIKALCDIDRRFMEMFDKYKSAYYFVYDNITYDYTKQKENLNILTWIDSEIKKTKDHMKTNRNNAVFTILLTEKPDKPDKLDKYDKYDKNDKDYDNNYDLNKQFDELYQQDNSTKSSGEYFKSLSIEQKKEYITKLKEIKNIDNVGNPDNLEKKPNIAKVLEWNTSNSNKSMILSKLNTFENLKGSSEFYKLKTWLTKIMKVPFGKYVKAPVERTDTSEKIREYLQKVRKDLDADIYGHSNTKEQLIKILAHTIANPEEGGNVFALQGPPGVGKTALIQDGISKALGRPFTFISLGGATDACFLEGHDYTYEGSNHGRIVDLLHQAKCMNPIIYFDELDKVSDTAKGEEIINILMHITDSTQNSHFNDKYFGGIDFDLSKAIIIFSFNDVDACLNANASLEIAVCTILKSSLNFVDANCSAKPFC